MRARQSAHECCVSSSVFLNCEFNIYHNQIKLILSRGVTWHQLACNRTRGFNAGHWSSATDVGPALSLRLKSSHMAAVLLRVGRAAVFVYFARPAIRCSPPSLFHNSLRPLRRPSSGFPRPRVLTTGASASPISVKEPRHRVMGSIKLTELEERIFQTLTAAEQHAGLGCTLRCAGGWVRDKLLGMVRCSAYTEKITPAGSVHTCSSIEAQTAICHLHQISPLVLPQILIDTICRNQSNKLLHARQAYLTLYNTPSIAANQTRPSKSRSPQS